MQHMVISIKEFSEKVGKPINVLTTYITRRKLTVSGEGPNRTIDLSLPENSDFLEKWVERNNDKKAEVAEIKSENPPEQEEAPIIVEQKIISLKEFAEKVGKPTNALSVYIKRSKIIVSGEKPNQTVDCSLPENLEFLQKWGKNITDFEIKTETPPPPGQIPIKTKAKKSVEKESNGNIEKNGQYVIESSEFRKLVTPQSSDNALSKAKKFYDGLHREQEYKLKVIDELKKRGELIPTDFVKQIIATHHRSTVIAYKDANEKFITRLVQKYKLTLDDAAAIRADSVSTINSAANTAVEVSKKDLKRIIREFSNQRGVGEHG